LDLWAGLHATRFNDNAAACSAWREMTPDAFRDEALRRAQAMPPPTAPTSPRLVLLLTENHTMVARRDLRALVRMAAEAEDAGFDGVMASEHITLGPDADAHGRMSNPRDMAMAYNQDPTTPWPSSIVLLSAVAAVTTRLRLVAGAVIAPLRHPLLLAKQFVTLDLLSEGRLVVIPVVGWNRHEYEALGVPWSERGARLDEQLAAWRVLWREAPASFEGRHYQFHDVYLEPRPEGYDGPTLWIGGGQVHPRVVRRLVTYGHGFAPLQGVRREDLARIATAMTEAGRDISELELVGGTPARFSNDDGVADLDQALAAIPRQLERGVGTIMIKPSQFIDDRREFARWCRDVVARVAQLGTAATS
jgi:probable F420-dependent oxidoreductase